MKCQRWRGWHGNAPTVAKTEKDRAPHDQTYGEGKRGPNLTVSSELSCPLSSHGACTPALATSSWSAPLAGSAVPAPSRAARTGAKTTAVYRHRAVLQCSERWRSVGHFLMI